jgi:hypothetical protein
MWPSLGEKRWTTLRENAWPSIARKMTGRILYDECRGARHAPLPAATMRCERNPKRSARPFWGLTPAPAALANAWPVSGPTLKSPARVFWCASASFSEDRMLAVSLPLGGGGLGRGWVRHNRWTRWEYTEGRVPGRMPCAPTGSRDGIRGQRAGGAMMRGACLAWPGRESGSEYVGIGGQ